MSVCISRLLLPGHTHIVKDTIRNFTAEVVGAVVPGISTSFHGWLDSCKHRLGKTCEVQVAFRNGHSSFTGALRRNLRKASRAITPPSYDLFILDAFPLCKNFICNLTAKTTGTILSRISKFSYKPPARKLKTIRSVIFYAHCLSVKNREVFA